jgi:hypothetical protein
VTLTLGDALAYCVDDADKDCEGVPLLLSEGTGAPAEEDDPEADGVTLTLEDALTDCD